MSIRHEARGGLADGLKQSFTRKEAADWAANVGRDMWLAGLQRGLELAKEHAVMCTYGEEYIDWSAVEKAIEAE